MFSSLRRSSAVTVIGQFIPALVDNKHGHIYSIVMRKIILLCLFFTPYSSRGNDTAANVETGNIIFKKSRDIIMESEDLSISPLKISVKYSFRNNTKKPIEETVVFPLPPSNSVSGGWNAPDPENPKNTLNFVLKVDGKSKPFDIHAKREDISKEDDVYIIARIRKIS